MSVYDVAVVGQGAIGSAAALAFARAGRRVALVAPHSAPAASASVIATRQPPPRTWDQRVYALSPASRALLTDLGVWQFLDAARVAPVHDMRICHSATHPVHRAPPLQVHLGAYEGRVEALAWIVENRELQGALDRAIAATVAPGGLTRVDAVVDGLSLPLAPPAHESASLSLAGGGRLSAELVIAADGTSSRLRDFAGITHEVRDYDQTAIVANFEAGRPHRDCAWQWFGDFGVIALLPLPSGDLGHGGSRVSLVWSAPADEAVRALGADGEPLDLRVEKMTGGRLGSLRMITPAAAFPLRAVRCRQVIKPSFVLIGDAAHAVHPMAGQGMNLGFGDIRGLLDHVLKRRDFAAPATAPDWFDLRRYERSRREPVAVMQLALDGLHWAFNDVPTPLAGLRDLGWSLVARSEWLRRRMIEHAVS
jgi:ubiquinone biosynthesis UbiH/UbiF/VisC/COQ6 family hydroxylase